MSNVYDTIIIGSGPAGLSAAIYAARSGMKTLILEKEKLGGQIVLAEEIVNYPGSMLEGETGVSLTNRMAEQAKTFGAERVMDGVKEVFLSETPKRIVCNKGEYLAKTVIIATGAHPRLAGCPGEKEYTGKGVSYCATCDGAFFEGLEIYVIGGGDSAVEEGIYLSKFGRKVTIIHRRDELRASKALQQAAFANEKIDFLWDSVVQEIKGEEGVVNALVVKNVKTGELTEIKADEDDGLFGVFVFIGMLPATDLFKDQIELAPDGHIITGEDMKTKVPGVFAAGDVRQKPLKQVVTAVSDGATAAAQAFWFIEGLG